MTNSVLRPPPDESLKLSEYAHALGISTRTAHRWIKSGRITAHQTKGGHWRVNPDQLAQGTLTPTQFAQVIGMSPVTVRRWCQANSIPHSTLPNGQYRIPMTEVPRAPRLRKRSPR